MKRKGKKDLHFLFISIYSFSEVNEKQKLLPRSLTFPKAKLARKYYDKYSTTDCHICLRHGSYYRIRGLKK